MGLHFEVQNNILCQSLYRLSGSDKRKTNTVQIGVYFQEQRNLLSPLFYRLSGKEKKRERIKLGNPLKFTGIYFVHCSIGHLELKKA